LSSVVLEKKKKKIKIDKEITSLPARAKQHSGATRWICSIAFSRQWIRRQPNGLLRAASKKEVF
jgi:hypothetical protein